ncbi:MAG: M1 family peptidase [Nitrospirae bacterium]|nr:M1 family peptidase [Nitrospirota bacterium]
MDNVRLLMTGLVFLITSSAPVLLHAEELIRHALKVVIQPDKNHLQVEDTITFPESFLAASGRKLHFLLHDGLQPISQTPGVKLNREPARIQNDASQKELPPVPAGFIVSLPTGRQDFVIQYEGRINPPATAQKSDETTDYEVGHISEEGIFLSGAARWVPWFNDDPITFSLEVELPEPWDAVSLGERTRHEHKDGRIETRWESPQPQDEILLLGGRFTEYDRPAGSIQVMAFLRTPNEALAGQYLETGGSYLEMYQNLLGPYLYKKFAMVENFWETGYGMPSLTLLGSSVIRLPFILDSSYPHEILHNWWGNGVFVDYEKGNWSEGLTTYLADHLIQEQRGTAVEYRRATLQKYADYVAERKDFPLTEFRSRHSPATEAVGYGKTMMFFHMLRRRLGDAAFVQTLRTFYRENQFRRATFDDLRAAFAGVAGEDLKNEFVQWVGRAGAPALRVSGARTQVLGTGYLVTMLLEQTQSGLAYRLRVPVAVTMEGREQTYQTTVKLDTKRLGLQLMVPGRPTRIDVDPEFDLFRRLDRDELPPALSQSFGAEKSLFLIPAKADQTSRNGYWKFAESISILRQQSQSGSIEIKLDSEIDALPSDRAVWVLGWENRFFPDIKTALTGYALSATPNGLRIAQTEAIRDGHAIVLTARHPKNSNAPLTWLAVDRPAALPGLARKLPHYGPYSYLVFEGDEPKNILKGRWEVPNSPLSAPVLQPDGRTIPTARAILEPRRALTQ